MLYPYEAQEPTIFKNVYKKQLNIAVRWQQPAIYYSIVDWRVWTSSFLLIPFPGVFPIQC